MLLSDVCLTSVVYIGPNSRTERPRKTKIGTELANVTRDLDTTFKVKRSRSPGRFTQRGLNAWGRCSGDHENVLGVGNYWYVASARRRASTGEPTGRRGGAYRVAMLTACLLYICFSVNRRAALYVRGNDEGKIKKIPSLNVDCVSLDCEDGVALNRKVCMLFRIICNYCWQCCLQEVLHAVTVLSPFFHIMMFFVSWCRYVYLVIVVCYGGRLRETPGGWWEKYNSNIYNVRFIN